MVVVVLWLGSAEAVDDDAWLGALSRPRFAPVLKEINAKSLFILAWNPNPGGPRVCAPIPLTHSMRPFLEWAGMGAIPVSA